MGFGLVCFGLVWFGLVFTGHLQVANVIFLNANADFLLIPHILMKEFLLLHATLSGVVRKMQDNLLVGIVIINDFKKVSSCEGNLRKSEKIQCISGSVQL